MKALEKKLKSETERYETWRVVFISKGSINLLADEMKMIGIRKVTFLLFPGISKIE